VVQNAVQNPGVQNVRNHNGLIVVLGIANQNGSGNVVAARAEGNASGNNGDADHTIFVHETFHEQTDDELTEMELKQVEVDDQAIQTILLSLLEDIYAAVEL
nr:hypothetical protein [Tanacetum cinerariifolium]